jgi:uncharacterized protein YjbI with pentapeptide repeats|tara:strand:- start:27 stop:230 length:204 start_codon:yes stop_codon:yes gene_type:complete
MRNITKEELEIVLKNHALWVDSDGSEGKRADLTGVDLTCADLTGADLTYVDLTYAKLTGSIRDEVGK